MLVAQTGIASLVQWLRSPDEVLQLTGEVFRSAPRELARSVTLQQTVELVQQTIAVAEEQLPQLADARIRRLLREEMLLFSREIAFAAARVYASVAEVRGAWDARLEALVIEGLVRGSSIVDEPAPQLAALGWRSTRPDHRGRRRDARATSQEVLADLHRLARRAGFDAMAAVHGDRLVVVLGGIGDPVDAAAALIAGFGDGPVVAGPIAADVDRRKRGDPGRVVGPARGAGMARGPAAGQRRRAAAGAGASRRCRRPRTSSPCGSTSRSSTPMTYCSRRSASSSPAAARSRRRPGAVRARQHRAVSAAAGRRGHAARSRPSPRGVHAAGGPGLGPPRAKSNRGVTLVSTDTS